MRRIAKTTFKAGFVLGRRWLHKELTGGEISLDEELEMAAAEEAFKQFEGKLMEIYGGRN